MSYLSPLRLHFAGKFQAAPSTVNNDATHYNNATFIPSYQQPESGNQLNGWWNPSGDAVFRLANCSVTSAWLNGVAVTNDPVLSMKVADTDRKAPGKMVDLDPEQQMVSQLWGLQIRLCAPGGSNVLVSDFAVTGFTDIWQRDVTDSQNVVGDGIFSAFYQSVLTNLDWAGDISSPFLDELRKQTENGELSIKFNVDGYDMLSFTSPWFTYGRIAGTIGPQRSNNPKQFTLGRHLMPVLDNNGNPEGGIYFCTAVVDSATSKVLLDVGNALPTVGCGGPQQNIGALSLICQQSSGPLNLGPIDYLAPNWYENTAGVVALPPDRSLTKAELATLAANPLAIIAAKAAIEPSVAIAEPADGLYVRADNFVYRLDPGESAQVSLWATTFGLPQANAAISVIADPSGLQVSPGWPSVAVPAAAITFPASLTTDAQGHAALTITASDPGNARGYIDGQLYGVRPLPADIPQDYPVNPSDFISLLVWTKFVPTKVVLDDPITWYGSMQPIFQQYANLYPVMLRFLDLSKYEDICKHLRLLTMSFSLNEGDPNFMPVIRDLSGAKRRAILKWLTTLDADGKPALGTSPVAPPTAPLPITERAMPSAEVLARGGKSAAIARRGQSPWVGRSATRSTAGEAQ